MSLLCVGSIALDTIETPHGTRENILGGSCVYFAFASRLLSKPRIVGVIGEDFDHLPKLTSAGIDCTAVRISAGKTFKWHGKYEGDMSRAITLGCDLNTFENFNPQIPPSHTDSELVLLGNSSPHTQMHVLSQLKSPRFVVLDTMNFWIERENEALMKLLSRVNAICINEGEALLLSRENTLENAIEKLAASVEYLIVKLAHNGAIVANKEWKVHVPAYRTDKVVDPTGAGDSFAGGFLGYLAMNGVSEKNIKQALAYGCALGSFAVEDFGPIRLENLTHREIDSRAASLLTHAL